MAPPSTISPTIIETLYSEALLMSDEAREIFGDAVRNPANGALEEDLTQIALSCEALRTTTRMLHAIAWLLNQRAYLAGELSEFQLRHHGRLPPAQPAGDHSQYVLLELPVAELVARTQRFYARIERLDQAWRQRFVMHPAAIHRLRDRLGRAVAAL